jgi:16S rRNA (cytosine967-C5)-methyltransferase
MIQDEAAMLAGTLSGARAGDQIMDVCAAPGGKSCHMAELSSDQANILALDIHENRLKLIGENALRLGIQSIHTGISDARNPDGSITGPEKSYDIVLADVPCSGLGLLLRKPDIRLTVTYDRIVALLEVQKEILIESSRFVKPGGVLMYCTCTLNPDENENRVDAFLKEYPEFKPEPLDRLLPPCLMTSSRHAEEAAKGRTLLLPDDDGCDGFFIAKMRRTA